MGILIIFFPHNISAEKCNIVIVQRSFDSNDVIEDFDIQNTSYNLRMKYYEKYFQNFNSATDMIYLLPTDNKIDERKQIMKDYGIYEQVPSNLKYGGIGVPEDILQYLSDSSGRKGVSTVYYYTVNSTISVNQWKDYWSSNSQNTEYVDRMYKILQYIIPQSNMSNGVRERATAYCTEIIDDPKNGMKLPEPIPEDILKKEIAMTHSYENTFFSEILYWILLALTIASALCATIIFILYKKKRIFQTQSF